MIASSAAAIAPLLAGGLIGAWGPVATALLFAGAVGAAAIAATVSRGIRTAQPLAEIAAAS